MIGLTKKQRKKLTELLLEDKVVERVFSDFRKITVEEIQRTTNVKKSKEHVTVDLEKIIEKIVDKIAYVEKNQIDDVSTLTNLIEVAIRQNVEQQKKIVQIQQILNGLDLSEKTRKQLKQIIGKSKKEYGTSELEQKKILRFLKRHFDDEARNTTLD
ncbi:hypothetical protein [Nitrosopumilus sp.]|uniref:hypothetical protein n=1 Tax=Nitrosopumilus sp. TaxID=2024843 RepID=UPI0034A04979